MDLNCTMGVDEETFTVKFCGNKPGKKLGEIQGGVSRIVTDFSREQEERREQGVFLGPEIDLRIGMLVGQKHMSDDFVTAGDVARIIENSSPEITSAIIVVTHLDTIADLTAMIDETRARAIQLHISPSPELVEELKKRYPDHEFWNVSHAPQSNSDPSKRQAEGRDAVKMADELVAAGVTTIVLDRRHKDKAGGTGKEVNQRYAEWYRQVFGEANHNGRLVIAGGLNPRNVSKKIQTIRPNGVDVNSGVNRSKKKREKDPRKVQSLLRRSHKAAYDLHQSGLWVPS